MKQYQRPALTVIEMETGGIMVQSGSSTLSDGDKVEFRGGTSNTMYSGRKRGSEWKEE